MKELNEKVERAIDRTDTKRMLAATKKKKVFDPNHMGLVKDKELENAQNQLAAYEKEIEGLQIKIEEISQVDKMLEKEQLLKDNKNY